MVGLILSATFPGEGRGPASRGRPAWTSACAGEAVIAKEGDHG